MYHELLYEITKFTSSHCVEDVAMVMCNIMLDLLEIADEEFSDEVVAVVMSNDRFDLEE